MLTTTASTQASRWHFPRRPCPGAPPAVSPGRQACLSPCPPFRPPYCPHHHLLPSFQPHCPPRTLRMDPGAVLTSVPPRYAVREIETKAHMQMPTVSSGGRRGVEERDMGTGQRLASSDVQLDLDLTWAPAA